MALTIYGFLIFGGFWDAQLGRVRSLMVEYVITS